MEPTLNFSSVQFSSVIQSCLTLRRHGLQHTRPPCPSLPLGAYSKSTESCLLVMSIESVMSCNHLILCHPLLLLPSIFPSISVFSNELFLRIRWPKYWSFCFSISPSMNTQDWISLGWIGWSSLKSNKLPRVFSKLQFKSINSLALSFLYGPGLIYLYWLLEKP